MPHYMLHITRYILHSTRVRTYHATCDIPYHMLHSGYHTTHTLHVQCARRCAVGVSWVSHMTYTVHMTYDIYSTYHI